MNEKISERHLRRLAIVYVRQSSQHQVQHCQESQRLQYAMEQRVRALGWQEVVVIDEDLGHSASGATQRGGFVRMVSEIGLGRVGAVAAREVSRFARNNRDWHQLVEMCSLVDTLLIDHEAIYDARRGNDRLLLGLKGSLSEYELDLLRQRSLEARWQKARRGELVQVGRAGFVCDQDGHVEMEPDLRVQGAIKLIFDKFFELGSARQVLMWFIDAGLQVPTRRFESGAWVTCWKRPAYRMIVRVLADPTYAGAYVFGRTVQLMQIQDGVVKKKSVRRPRAEIPVLIRDHHEGYISWEQFEKAQQMLVNNTRGFDATRSGAAKTGVALLAGLLRCRRCGRKLMVYYGGRSDYRVARYNCYRGRVDNGDATCINFAGQPVDDIVAAEVLQVVEPAAIEATMLAASKICSDKDDTLKALKLELEAARYAAQRAWKQFDAADPDNRLVADELERRCNVAMQRQRDIEKRVEDEQAQRERRRQPTVAQLQTLTSDLRDVWEDPQTDVRLKKRILRTLIEEIVVDVDDDRYEVVLILHWKGGVHSELRVARRRRGYSSAKSTPEVVEAIRQLARICTDRLIAAYLNRNGVLSGHGHRWTQQLIASSRSTHKIPRFTSENRDASGWMTLTEAARCLHISTLTLRRAVERGVVHADHPLADGPWIFQRGHLEEPTVTKAFAHLKQPGKPTSLQTNLAIPNT